MTMPSRYVCLYFGLRRGQAQRTGLACLGPPPLPVFSGLARGGLKHKVLNMENVAPKGAQRMRWDAGTCDL